MVGDTFPPEIDFESMECLRLRWPPWQISHRFLWRQQFQSGNLWEYASSEDSWKCTFMFFLMGRISHKAITPTLACVECPGTWPVEVWGGYTWQFPYPCLNRLNPVYATLVLPQVFVEPQRDFSSSIAVECPNTLGLTPSRFGHTRAFGWVGESRDGGRRLLCLVCFNLMIN